ncbi:hypothetical protein RRG08_023745 [Elysia crispata]|uniref:Reverse transcriptase domain-containing protein n=1 Tax=Elysia crispata TaxID=231223 RepID=A0AAE0ZW04_9GAST|nr:hypothetical protein RRG08_023745 [Elysia crispata]
MKKFGYSSKFTTRVLQFHDGMMVKVLDEGDESNAFLRETNGVKQGCILAPTLFSMMFSAMLTDTFQACEDGMPCSTSERTEQQMQNEMDCLSTACDNFGFIISAKKNEVMYQPAPGKPYQEPHFTVKRQKLQAVDTFTYLGSTLSRAATIDVEVNDKIAKASTAFGRLRENVDSTTLLYASETWSLQQARSKAQPFPPELPPQTAKHQMAGQNPRHGGPGVSQHAQRLHPPTERSGQMLYSVVPRHTNSGRAEETLQMLPKNLPQRPQNRYQGDICHGPSKLAQQARGWCSCSRDSTHHRGSEKA